MPGPPAPSLRLGVGRWHCSRGNRKRPRTAPRRGGDRRGTTHRGLSGELRSAAPAARNSPPRWPTALGFDPSGQRGESSNYSLHSLSEMGRRIGLRDEPGDLRSLESAHCLCLAVSAGNQHLDLGPDSAQFRKLSSHSFRACPLSKITSEISLAVLFEDVDCLRPALG